MLKPYINKFFVYNNKKSKSELGVEYIESKKTIIDMGYDLIDKGMVVDKIKNRK